MIDQLPRAERPRPHRFVDRGHERHFRGGEWHSGPMSRRQIVNHAAQLPQFGQHVLERHRRPVRLRQGLLHHH